MRQKWLKTVLIILICILTGFAAGELLPQKTAARIPVKVLILPKFEVGELDGDFPGEAQHYYQTYLKDSAAYDVSGNSLYVKDGVALCVTGMGKVSAALTVMSVLTDPRFDFSDAYVISTGCAGTARDTTVMGDVFLITAAVDYDHGHHADIREMISDSPTTWFHDESYDDSSVVLLDPDLMNNVYDLIRDVPVHTTERTRSFMEAAFDGAEWAVRDPMVLRGTSVTSDNYWKGEFDHQNALLITETYHCPDPYAATEMEDIAIALTMKRLNMLDRLIILRGSVNIDVFMMGDSPETLWAPDRYESIASEDSVESADIFATAMENIFNAGSVITDAVLAGKLENGTGSRR